ncbi:hypothetical protein ACFVSK_11190 [Cellulosimicrobium cellulans]|uniref:hypothetical protein n=1 Tax=Cellulosimicrobium cellulans TaxID=1710 RepID=UPI0036F142C3
MDEREIDKQSGPARPRRLHLPVWAGKIAIIAGALVVEAVIEDELDQRSDGYDPF